MTQRFIGREDELALLAADYDSDRSELCVVYGRRRIGKSTLLLKLCEGRQMSFLLQLAPQLRSCSKREAARAAEAGRVMVSQALAFGFAGGAVGPPG